MKDDKEYEDVGLGVVEEWESGGGQGDVPTWNGGAGTGERFGKGDYTQMRPQTWGKKVFSFFVSFFFLIFFLRGNDGRGLDCR